MPKSAVKRLPVAPIAVALLGLAVHGRASDGPSLTDILDRAGRYVPQYEQDLSVVMSDEDYHQDESFMENVRLISIPSPGVIAPACGGQFRNFSP
jgi:hypothetical protein